MTHATSNVVSRLVSCRLKTAGVKTASNLGSVVPLVLSQPAPALRNCAGPRYGVQHGAYGSCPTSATACSRERLKARVVN